MELSAPEQEVATLALNRKYERAKAGTTNRNFLYDLRRAYYDGKIFPDVERGHDLVYTQFAATIVDRTTAYAAANGMAVKFKAPDVSDKELLFATEKANAVADMLYNTNDHFQEQVFLLFHTSGLYGDGYLDTIEVDGMPTHKSINNPQNIYLGFQTNFYDEMDFWLYEQAVSVDEIKDTFNIEVSPMPLQNSSPGLRTNSSHLNPFGFDTSNVLRQVSVDANAYDPKMAMYVIMNDLLKGERIQAFNHRARYRDDKITKLYHFKGNVDPGRPYGLCDFETVAHLITKYEAYLSMSGDAIAQSVNPKLITDQNATELQNRWKPNKTQIYKLPPASSGGGRLEVLNLSQQQPMNVERILDNLLNAIRTGSGLQELGQDTISANVSGRAIAQMYQGVQQKIKSKRLRFSVILNDLIVDDFRTLAKSDSDLKKLCFDKDGNFRFKIDVKYPPVLEQDEQIRTSIIQVQTQGENPLMSQYTARTLLSDYIDDPTEEAARIDQEQEAIMQRKIKLQQGIAASQPGQQPPAGDNATTTGQAIAPQGVEPVGESGSGVVSTPGAAGTATQAQSPSGFQAQQQQQANQQ